jgi:rRNA biogenesis protein RRP5
VTNASSVLPGMLVQSLVTAVDHTGVNLQVLGFFEGTVDLFQLPPGPPENSYKVGSKIKARVLYAIPNTPPRFALSLAEHIIGLAPRSTLAEGVDTVADLQEAYPAGTVLETVKIVRVENERGLIAEVQPHIQGYIHVCFFPRMAHPTHSDFFCHRFRTYLMTTLHPFRPTQDRGKSALHTRPV